MMGQKLGHKILAWPSRDHIKASFIIIMNVTLRSCLPRSLKDKQCEWKDNWNRCSMLFPWKFGWEEVREWNELSSHLSHPTRIWANHVSIYSHEEAARPRARKWVSSFCVNSKITNEQANKVSSGCFFLNQWIPESHGFGFKRKCSLAWKINLNKASSV